jgi:membrane protein DedA with SNARE-associated domain
LNVVRFALAIAIGRAVRFLLEGYLAVQYGDRADVLFKFYFPWIGLGLALLIILIFVGRKMWRKRAKEVLSDR